MYRKKSKNRKNTKQIYMNKKYPDGKRKQIKSVRMKVYEVKIVWNERQLSNIFLKKPNGKCTQPNKKVYY